MEDTPKTRREYKKSPKEKKKNNSIYSSKHVRIQENTKSKSKK